MPLQNDVVIGDLRPEERSSAVDIFADAFLDFPLLQVMAGTDVSARGRLRRMFAMQFEPDAHIHALAARADGRLVGALTYVDSPDCSAMSAGRMVRFARIAGPRIFHTMRLFMRVERVHPQTAHRHLPTVGVLPPFHSQGIGRRLMEVFGRRCDEEGRIAYLETIRWADPERPSHERFYTRLGYAIADVVPMTDAWQVLTMVRQPGASSES